VVAENADQRIGHSVPYARAEQDGTDEAKAEAKVLGVKSWEQNKKRKRQDCCRQTRQSIGGERGQPQRRLGTFTFIRPHV